MPSNRPDVYLIGLTGNIATGKSTVDALLAGKGARIVDADALVHDLQRQGQPVFLRIVEKFGQQVVGADGELDRQRLASLVFGNLEALRTLEGMVHPAVGAAMRQALEEAPAGSVLVYDAVKLMESGSAAICDSLWVVTSPEEVQLQRLTGLRGMAADAAEARIRAQGSPATKIARADIVISNDGSLESLASQVDAAWEKTAGAWQRERSRVERRS